MKNMKALLKLLGVISLTTVATSSIVACDYGSSKEMTAQVKKDFGFLDNDNNSLIRLDTSKEAQTGTLKWSADKLNSITADNLLESGDIFNKAKSSDSADFLVNVLKMKSTSGVGKERTFSHNDARSINLKIKSFLPNIVKVNTNDYELKNGTILIVFEQNEELLSDTFSLDISEKLSRFSASNKLPDIDEFGLSAFTDIPEIKVGQPKSQLPIGTNLTPYLKYENGWNKTLRSLTTLLNFDESELKILVSQISDETGNFVQGDTIKIKISIGEVVFAIEYTLTVS